MSLLKRCHCGRAKWPRCDHAWHYRFKAGGSRHEGTTSTASRREAEKVERAARVEVQDAPPANPSGRNVTLAYLAGLDVERAVAEHPDSECVAKDTEQHWRPVVRIVGDIHPKDVTDDTPYEYVRLRRTEVRRGKRPSAQTIRRELWAFHRGLEIALRKRWIRRMPMGWPELASDPIDTDRAGKIHAPEVIRDWLAELTQDARDEAVSVGLTGMRAVQLRRLRHAWLEEAPAGLGVPLLFRVPPQATKHRKQHIMPVVEDLAAIVVRRRQHTPESELVFSQESHTKTYRTAARRALDKAVERLVDAGGVDEKQALDLATKAGYGRRITRRDLRHWVATTAERESGDKKATADLLGHQRMTTTDVYLHSTLERVIGVALDVQSVFRGDITGGTTVAGIDVSTGGSSEIRTRGQRIKSPDMAAHRHLSGCLYCQSVVDAHTKMQASALVRGGSEGGQEREPAIAEIKGGRS